MLTGGLIKGPRRAECRRYAVELAVRELEGGQELDVTSALDAQAATLRTKLPDAKARLAESAARLEAGHVNGPTHAADRRRAALGRSPRRRSDSLRFELMRFEADVPERSEDRRGDCRS